LGLDLVSGWLLGRVDIGLPQACGYDLSTGDKVKKNYGLRNLDANDK